VKIENFVSGLRREFHTKHPQSPPNTLPLLSTYYAFRKVDTDTLNALKLIARHSVDTFGMELSSIRRTADLNGEDFKKRLGNLKVTPTLMNYLDRYRRD